MSLEVTKTVIQKVAIKGEGVAINLVFSTKSVAFDFSVKGTAGYIVIANDIAKALADSITEGLTQ
jgi:predicted transcriptional regulator